MKRLYIVTLLIYAKYIMWNARLDESQAEIKTAGRNINNLRYADDTTLGKEELKNLFMMMKGESEKASLQLNIEKKKLRSWHLVQSLHGK